jgi:hypothetical protein
MIFTMPNPRCVQRLLRDLDGGEGTEIQPSPPLTAAIAGITTGLAGLPGVEMNIGSTIPETVKVYRVEDPTIDVELQRRRRSDLCCRARNRKIVHVRD